ncbi:MAG: RNA polymerase subunit sigma [Planctomycetes bacterium]|nr:RNA polymerase subunit sigma [Planctomycetota bacterium]
MDEPAISADLPEDRGRLFEILAAELRRIAGGLADRQGTLQPTALVNEAFLRLCGDKPRTWNDRSHFLRSAAMTMRRILIDHKRRKQSLCNGGGAMHEPLDETIHWLEQNCGAGLEDLDQAIDELAKEEPRLAEYVTLRFFGGRTNAETCSILDISRRTGERDWDFARTWLYQRLSR